MASRQISSLLRPVTHQVSRFSRPGTLQPLSTTANQLTKGPNHDSPSTPSKQGNAKIMLEDESAFGFIRHNTRPPKPRKVGVTEIRGPYYSAMGKRYLKDVLET